MASDATESKQEAEMEPTGEAIPEAPASGKRRFHFRQHLRRIFMRAKKKPNAHSGSVTLLNVPGTEDNSDERLGARAMSLDSVFQPDTSPEPERPTRVLSQDNLAGRVSAFKNQLLKTLRIASPSRLIAKRRAAPEGNAVASASPARWSQGSLRKNGTQSLPRDQALVPEQVPAPEQPLTPEQGGNNWCAPVSLDERPSFTATLDNSAAKHRMAVRPKNQRTGARPRRANASASDGPLSPASSSFAESPSLVPPGHLRSPTEKRAAKRPALVPPSGKRAPSARPAPQEEPDDPPSGAVSPQLPESPANDGGDDDAAFAALKSGQSLRLPRVQAKPRPAEAPAKAGGSAAASSDESDADGGSDGPPTYDPIRLPRPTLRGPGDAAADGGTDSRRKLPHRSASEIGFRAQLATARSKSLPRGSDHPAALVPQAGAYDAVDAGEAGGRRGDGTLEGDDGGGGGGVFQKAAKRGRARTQRPASAVEPMIGASAVQPETPGADTRPFGVKLRRTPQSQSFCQQQQQQQQQPAAPSTLDDGRLRPSGDGVKTVGSAGAVREGGEAEEGDAPRPARGSGTPGTAGVRSNPDGSSDPSGSDDHSPTDCSPPWRSLAERKSRAWSNLEQETIAIL